MRVFNESSDSCEVGVDSHTSCLHHQSAGGIDSGTHHRIAGTDFAPGEWSHVALFDEQENRIEMHLEATADLVVRWEGGERRFAAGERIHTENSYKYTLESFGALLHDAGMQTVDVWTDPRRFFAVFVAAPER